MVAALNIDSETGTLKRVIVHTPGPEIEAMSPSEAEGDLYNDIIPLGIVLNEHSELKSFLSLVAKTEEATDLLASVLGNEEYRHEYVELLVGLFGIEHRREDLEGMDAKSLAVTSIRGLPARNESLETHLESRRFDLKPLPNMYFMRDSALTFRNTGVSCAMRFDVRFMESLITRFILTRHPDFRGNGLLFDGAELRKPGFSLEGGDFQVISKNVVAIGISERTSARAIDQIARDMAKSYDDEITVFAVDLPKARATIHLDMAFTVIDRDACLIYEPVILGKDRARVIRLDVPPTGKITIRDVDSLLSGLKSVGIDLKPILAGGPEPVHQHREQWMSGANSFAFAPGKIIMYSCNVHTVEALAREGFAVKKARDFISGKDKPAEFSRLVVGFDGVELARGGGGARCMTLPVERESLRV